MKNGPLLLALTLFCAGLTSLLVPAHGQEIGLQLYSLRDQFAKDVPGTMAKVKNMGIKEIEIGGTYGLAFPEFIKLLASNNLSVVSFGADFERLEKFPQAVADEARSYGAKYVVCFWLPHKADALTPEEVKHAAEVLNNAGLIMKQNGLSLCYHPHGYEFGSYADGTLFDFMVTSFDARYVNFEMDVFWVKQAGQDPLALLRKHPNRFLLLHLKDRKPGSPNSSNGKADIETNVVLGSGDVGIAALIKEARKIGVKHFFIEDESSQAEKQIPQSLTYLKTLNQQ